MAWYQHLYINRRDWILTHLDSLNLSSDEVLILLYIDLCNSASKDIDANELASTLNLSQDQLDKAIAQLVAGKQLVIGYSDGKVEYNIDGVFTYENPTVQTENFPLLETIQQQFGRKLSLAELKKLADLRDCYSEDLLQQALRETLFYQKDSIDYMASVAANLYKER